MTDNEGYRKRCEGYRAKCQQHLRRTELARRLALSQVAPGAGFLAANRQLVDEALGGTSPDPLDALRSVITRTHFLLLKVEFEFFLVRMAHCVWEHHLVAQAPDGWKGHVLQKVVPSHGLGRLAQSLKISTGVDLKHLLNKGPSPCWPQVWSAFEVRHLIEHANGKVDHAFLTQVVASSLWKNSSWGSVLLAEGGKVPIREEDFDATFHAMIAATDLLGTALEGWTPPAGGKGPSKGGTPG
jgi:hypothetical protein